MSTPFQATHQTCLPYSLINSRFLQQLNSICYCAASGFLLSNLYVADLFKVPALCHQVNAAITLHSLLRNHLGRHLNWTCDCRFLKISAWVDPLSLIFVRWVTVPQQCTWIRLPKRGESLEHDFLKLQRLYSKPYHSPYTMTLFDIWSSTYFTNDGNL